MSKILEKSVQYFDRYETEMNQYFMQYASTYIEVDIFATF